MKIKKLSGRELRIKRIKLNLTQEEAAKACNMHPTTVHNIETEKSSGFSTSYLKLIDLYNNINIKKIWKYKIGRKKVEVVPGIKNKGEELRELRFKYGYTQQDVAGKIGINRSTLNLYENNRLPVSKRMYNKIVEFYSISKKYSLFDLKKSAKKKLEKGEYEIFTELVKKLIR